MPCPRTSGQLERSPCCSAPSTERLCHLTPEHLKLGDKHTHLILGRYPVLLPPRLAELLWRLAEQPQLRPQLSRVHPGPRWLFPDMVPGKPISTHGMTQKLNRHGIPVRTARNAALAALAADLPSPILADVTGMHRHTALRWVAYARRDWPSTSPPEPRTRPSGEKEGIDEYDGASQFQGTGVEGSIRA